MLLSSVSASREVPALDSARSVASPPLSKRGVLGKDGVEMALKEWSGKYHRRQVEISEIAAHVEMLKKQRDTLQNEVKQQEKDITSLEAELAQQRDEQLPALKLRYENASRLKHKLNRAVAEQRAASRELQIRGASLTRDIERKRSEVSSARSRKESISRKVRELDERRKLAEKQKAHRERQLGKGLEKLRKSQTDILLAEREILTLKEGGARAVLAKSGGIPHAKETASGESPVTSRMATGVLKSSAGSVGHSTTTSAVLKRVVGAESSSEDEGETTHAATKGIHGRSAKPKPAGLEKLLGSVASSKPVVITEGDDEFEI